MTAALAAVDAQALGHALYDALNRRNEDALPWGQLVQSERNRYSRAAGEVVLRAEPTYVMLREEADDFREENKKLRAALAGNAEPAHHATGGEPVCRGRGYEHPTDGWTCTAQDRHAGDHVAYMVTGGSYATWPQS